MPKKINSSAVAVATEANPDSIAIQAVIDRRLALRLGVSLPVAAVVAGLAGIGPVAREAQQ